MKHSMSEVSTIFHPKKNRIPASSDEYSVNQPLDSLQKMIDNTGIHNFNIIRTLVLNYYENVKKLFLTQA